MTDGGLFAWGQNINGTLGDGTLNNSSVPLGVKFPKTVSAVTAAAAGTFHSLAVTNDGLYAWGTDIAGQLGTSLTKRKITPAKVRAEDNAAAVGAGEYFSVALQPSGSTRSSSDRRGEFRITDIHFHAPDPATGRAARGG